MRRRDNQTRTREVLCAIADGNERIYHLIQSTNTTYNEIKLKLLPTLIENNLVFIKKVEKYINRGKLSENPTIHYERYYLLTTKGKKAVSHIRKVMELLGE